MRCLPILSASISTYKKEKRDFHLRHIQKKKRKNKTNLHIFWGMKKKVPQGLQTSWKKRNFVWVFCLQIKLVENGHEFGCKCLIENSFWFLNLFFHSFTFKKLTIFPRNKYCESTKIVVDLLLKINLYCCVWGRVKIAIFFSDKPMLFKPSFHILTIKNIPKARVWFVHIFCFLKLQNFLKNEKPSAKTTKKRTKVSSMLKKALFWLCNKMMSSWIFKGPTASLGDFQNPCF